MSQINRAVVASDGQGHGCVLWYQGNAIQKLIEKQDLCYLPDLGLDLAPHGIWIWEGGTATCNNDMWLRGTFRPLDDGEWFDLERNVNPLPDVDPRAP
jgi:hypothetical protein